MLRTILNKVMPSAAAIRTSVSRHLATSTSAPKDDKSLESKAEDAQKKQKSTLSMAEQDEELKRKLAGISGDGGESGVEYEDGKPVAQKRSVKNNMFRLI